MSDISKRQEILNEEDTLKAAIANRIKGRFQRKPLLKRFTKRRQNLSLKPFLTSSRKTTIKEI